MGEHALDSAQENTVEFLRERRYTSGASPLVGNRAGQNGSSRFVDTMSILVAPAGLRATATLSWIMTTHSNGLIEIRSSRKISSSAREARTARSAISVNSQSGR